MPAPSPWRLDPARGELLLTTARVVAAAISAVDPHMVGHAERVAEYADAVARLLPLSAQDRFLLFITASFHDIGNLATPAYILRKPSALAEDEMEEVRVHPVRGASVFDGQPGLAEVARAIRHHHERLDGSGYPDGLRGDAIPIFSRIILVAETYEALTHHRSYRRAISHEEAIARLRESAGTQLDSRVVEHFAAAVRPAPKPP